MSRFIYTASGVLCQHPFFKEIRKESYHEMYCGIDYWVVLCIFKFATFITMECSSGRSLLRWLFPTIVYWMSSLVIGLTVDVFSLMFLKSIPDEVLFIQIVLKSLSEPSLMYVSGTYHPYLVKRKKKAWHVWIYFPFLASMSCCGVVRLLSNGTISLNSVIIKSAIVYCTVYFPFLARILEVLEREGASVSGLINVRVYCVDKSIFLTSLFQVHSLVCTLRKCTCRFLFRRLINLRLF